MSYTITQATPQTTPQAIPQEIQALTCATVDAAAQIAVALAMEQIPNIDLFSSHLRALCEALNCGAPAIRRAYEPNMRHFKQLIESWRGIVNERECALRHRLASQPIRRKAMLAYALPLSG